MTVNDRRSNGLGRARGCNPGSLGPLGSFTNRALCSRVRGWTGMASSAPRSIRIVPGELETKNAVTRLVIPSSGQSAWPPFVRAGETVVTRMRRFPSHFHEREEVLTYVSEGFATYRLDARPEDSLRPGSARLLTAPSRTTHQISPARAGSIRWFSLVVGMPASVAGEVRLQTSEPPPSPHHEEAAFVRPLVGPGTDMESSTGLECRELLFVEQSTTFQRIGHDRRGLVYVLSGRGSVEGQDVEAGDGAFAEGVAGIAIRNREGLRVIVGSAPR